MIQNQFKKPYSQIHKRKKSYYRKPIQVYKDIDDMINSYELMTPLYLKKKKDNVCEMKAVLKKTTKVNQLLTSPSELQLNQNDIDEKDDLKGNQIEKYVDYTTQHTIEPSTKVANNI